MGLTVIQLDVSSWKDHSDKMSHQLFYLVCSNLLYQIRAIQFHNLAKAEGAGEESASIFHWMRKYNPEGRDTIKFAPTQLRNGGKGQG